MTSLVTRSFIGLSSSLPTTSYVKMIDVWMIFTMTFPLFEVTLHTYKESLKKDLNQSSFPPTRPKVAQASVVPGKGKQFLKRPQC